MEQKQKIRIIKERIKFLSKEQKVLKNQRKTVYLVGERTMTPWQATIKHQTNRYELNRLFYLYDFIRDKELKSPINELQKENLIQQINNIVEEHGKIIHTSE